jgi:hypothetical protein
MPMLRRRTSNLLALVLGLAVLGGLVGTGYVLWTRAPLAGPVSLAAFIAAVAVCYALDEFGWLFVALACVFMLLAEGLYALWLLGVPLHMIGWIAAGLAGVIVIDLGRALIAAGSADYPYDD